MYYLIQIKSYIHDLFCDKPNNTCLVSTTVYSNVSKSTGTAKTDSDNININASDGLLGKLLYDLQYIQNRD